MPTAEGADREKTAARFEEYCERLGKLTGSYVEAELKLAQWCDSAGMKERASLALERARAVAIGERIPRRPTPPRSTASAATWQEPT
jgi:hypothetical protein